MAKSFRAVYKDAQGRTYSCPVEIHDGKWMLVTASGFSPITHTLDNEEYGDVTFDSYREVEPEDLRLHLPDRIGTENSFQQLQRGFVEQEIVAQRKQRREARAQAQQVSVNPAKVAEVRDLNNQLAHAKRPNGRGVGILPE
jgi:hypothetical protein